MVIMATIEDRVIIIIAYDNYYAYCQQSNTTL